MEIITRDKSFDVLKSIAIFLVIWGHVMQYFEYGMDVFNTHIGKIIGMINMPLFIFISGYFSVSTYNRSFLNVILNKSKQLLIPMTIFSLFIALLTFFYKRGGVIFLIKDIYYSFTGSYWFIWCILDCILCVWIFTHIFTRQKLIIALAIALTTIVLIPTKLFPVMADSEFKALFVFFILGIVFRVYNLNEYLKKYSLYLAIASLVVFVLTSLFFSAHDMFYYFAAMTPAEIIVPYLKMLIGGMSGIILLMDIVQKLTKYSSLITNQTALLGRYTLGIYLLQGVYFKYLNFNPISENNFLIQLGVSIIIFIICGICTLIFSKNVVLSAILLGNWKRPLSSIN